MSLDTKTTIGIVTVGLGLAGVGGLVYYFATRGSAAETEVVDTNAATAVGEVAVEGVPVAADGGDLSGMSYQDDSYTVKPTASSATDAAADDSSSASAASYSSTGTSGSSSSSTACSGSCATKTTQNCESCGCKWHLAGSKCLSTDDYSLLMAEEAATAAKAAAQSTSNTVPATTTATVPPQQSAGNGTTSTGDAAAAAAAAKAASDAAAKVIADKIAAAAAAKATTDAAAKVIADAETKRATDAVAKLKSDALAQSKAYEGKYVTCPKNGSVWRIEAGKKRAVSAPISNALGSPKFQSIACVILDNLPVGAAISMTDPVIVARKAAADKVITDAATKKKTEEDAKAKVIADKIAKDAADAKAKIDADPLLGLIASLEGKLVVCTADRKGMRAKIEGGKRRWYSVEWYAEAKSPATQDLDLETWNLIPLGKTLYSTSELKIQSLRGKSVTCKPTTATYKIQIYKITPQDTKRLYQTYDVYVANGKPALVNVDCALLDKIPLGTPITAKESFYTPTERLEERLSSILKRPPIRSKMFYQPFVKTKQEYAPLDRGIPYNENTLAAPSPLTSQTEMYYRPAGRRFVK